MILNLLSWFATVSVLLIYFALAKDVKYLRVYLWVNLLGSGVLGWFNVVHATWQNLVLNVAFGLISAWGLWHGRLTPRQKHVGRLRRRAKQLGVAELIPEGNV